MIQRLTTLSLLQFQPFAKKLPASQRIFSLIFWQFMVVILVAGVLSVFELGRIAYSVLFGSLTCIIPTSCFAIKFFARTGAQASQQIVRAFYKAELIKWCMTAGLFALTFKFIPVEPITFFISFIGTQTLFWCIPLLRR